MGVLLPGILSQGRGEPEPIRVDDVFDIRVVHQQDSISNVPSVSYWGVADPLYFISNPPGLSTALRFMGIPVPPGGVIDSLVVTVYSEQSQGSQANAWGMVGMEQADNPARLANAAQHEARKNNLGITTQWGPHGGIGGANLPFPSPDLSAMFQQIIDRPGWVLGNAVQFFFHPNPSTTIDFQFRSFFSGAAGTYPRIQGEFHYFI